MLLGRPMRRWRPATLPALLLVASCGGMRLEDRTTAPLLPAAALELVADLAFPPGNIAVSRTGRVFFSFHPGGDPPIAVAELVGGKPFPYPDQAFQARYQSDRKSVV